jgi:hypothetical protein
MRRDACSSTMESMLIHPSFHLEIARQRHRDLVARAALAPESEEEPLEVPRPDEPLSFAEHIRPLFREIDRRPMRFAFDPWSHDDVAEHSQAIPERLRAGSMPCDGTWPERANSEAS